MRRGELRRYIRPSRPDTPLTVLITSSNGVNDSSRATLIGLQVRPAGRGDLLDVPLGDGRWVWADHPTVLYRAWLAELVGLVDVVTMGRVSAARRAAEDLDVD